MGKQFLQSTKIGQKTPHCILAGQDSLSQIKWVQSYTITDCKMSVILGKYRNKRKLGKGAYGDVLLVEDPNGKELAIKMISKKIIQKDPFLQEYLEGEKDVMMSVKNRFVMELYAFEEDDNYKYFICEYCDGGDLLNYQAKQPNKVFDLKTATRILSQVIQGLEILHFKGYLHRDIKPQNILLKKQGNDSNYVYKLADFGFAKKMEDVGGTVLGTENYMSPEIFSNEVYSYQVDMWAFAVLFYFMLNMQFPFRINPHSAIEQKRSELLKQSTNFNYTEVVKKSKKVITDNCTEEVNDLFRKMFNPDGSKRITFVEIREHPLFKEYFPVIESQSRILYKGKKTINRYDSFVQGKLSGIQKPSKPVTKPAGKTQEDNMVPEMYVSKAKTLEQKAQLDAELDRIQFLSDTAEDLPNSFNFLKDTQLIAFKYNLYRYHVILMRQFHSRLNPESLEERYPKMKWKQFSKTSQFSSIKKRARDSIDQAELKVSQCYNQCQNIIGQIAKINPHLEQSLQYQVKTKQFSGPFKQSYRASTSRIYEQVRDKFSNGNKFSFLTAIIVICHSFNQLMACSEDELREVFNDFTIEKGKKEKPIQFTQLRSWMSTKDKDKIKGVIKGLLKAFFS